MSSAAMLTDINKDGKIIKAGRGAEQAELRLRVRPRDRASRYGRSSRRRCRRATCPARKASPTQPIPDGRARQAVHLRACLRARARRPHRLHAGAARRGPREPEALPPRELAVRAADSRRRQRPARHDQHRQHGRRHQLAGRVASIPSCTSSTRRRATRR
jgi:hypothetical protein